MDGREEILSPNDAIGSVQSVWSCLSPDKLKTLQGTHVFSMGEDPDLYGSAHFWPVGSGSAFFGGSGSRVSFLGKCVDFYIIDQISKKPWYFFTVN